MNDVVVSEIILRSVRAPLEKPVSAAGMDFIYRDYLLVELLCSDGSRGIGFSYIGVGGGEAARLATQDLLIDHVLGKNPWEVEHIWNAMHRATLIQGRAGIVMNGISAIDIALYDRNAKACNLPLHQFLGGTSKPIPAYASGGYYAKGKGLEELRAEIQGWKDQGFKAIKVKTGMLSIKEEEARMEVIRDVIGDDVYLMLDLYNSMPNLGVAVQYMEMYEKFNPYWIEDPFTPDDLDNFIELAKRTKIPFATGEFHYNSNLFKQIITSGAAKILQTEAPRCGGITEFKKIANMAASFGVTMSPCWFHQLHAHIIPSIGNGQFAEYFPDNSVLNFDSLIKGDKVTLIDGDLHLPKSPGIGFDFDLEAIAEMPHSVFKKSLELVS
jgi:L-alanine-DL-glutamate epimerase-like enolase superfamily enzyme